MTKEEVKDYLVNLFPDFADIWNSKDTLYKENDGSYTYHGLFGDFSVFFRDNINKFSDDQLKELFTTIEKLGMKETAIHEEWQSGKVDNEQQLSNAVFTGFLENIAGEGLTE